MKRKILIVIFCVFAIGVVVTTRPYLDDDATISYRYAASLAQGKGLIPFANGPRLEGYSNPTLVFSVATIGFLFRAVNLSNMLAIGLWINTLAALGILILLVKWERTGYFPAIALAGCMQWQNTRASGLETSLYTFLLTLAIFGFAKKMNKTALIASCLLALSRPEGIGLTALMATLYLFESKTEIRKHLKEIALFIVIPYGAFLVWRLYYFGALISNTSLAKTHLTDRHTFDGAGMQYFLDGMTVYPALLLLLALTLWRFFKDKPKYEMAVFLGQLIFIAVVGGDDEYFGPFRFLVPVFPILFRSLSVIIPESLPHQRKREIVLASTLLIIFCPTYSSPDRVWIPSWVYEAHDAGMKIPEKIANLVHPKPWLDEYFSEYLTQNVANAENLTLSSVQGGALLIHWKGKFQDIAGLLSKDYASTPGPEKEKLFVSNPPDIYAAFSHEYYTIDNNWIIQKSGFPSAHTLKTLGYKPILIYKINAPRVIWGGVIWEDYTYYVFTVYTRNPQTIQLADTPYYTAPFTYQDRSGKIEAIVPVITVQS